MYAVWLSSVFFQVIKWPSSFILSINTKSTCTRIRSLTSITRVTKSYDISAILRGSASTGTVIIKCAHGRSASFYFPSRIMTLTSTYYSPCFTADMFCGAIVRYMLPGTLIVATTIYISPSECWTETGSLYHESIHAWRPLLYRTCYPLRVFVLYVYKKS